MDRYQKVERPKPELPINENEIRITSQGLVRNYISYATSLLQERRGKEIVLKAMGQAISKTVAIAEIIKRRNPRLHQDTAISSVSIIDVWEPIEEGLLPVEMTRHVSMISITLSPKELNKNSPGYQAPPYVEQTRPQYNYKQQQQPHQQPRQAQYNYQQQPRQARAIYGAVDEDTYGRGRGRGRGEGRGRGWNRGGYGNYQENGELAHGEGRGRRGWNRGGYGNYQENGDLSHGEGSGRGWNRGGYGNYQENGDLSHGEGRGRGWNRGGYGNYQENGDLAHGEGRGRGWNRGGYGNYQEDGGYSNWGRGGGHGGNWGYRGTGYGRGRGGGGRGYGRGRGGRMGGRAMDGGNQA